MDIAVTWDSLALRGDWVIKNGGLAIDAGLHTSVLVSLFTNRRAPPDWKPPGGSPQTRGGYFGDSYTRRPLGSWLWLLWRSSVGDEKVTLQQAKRYCEIALQWLIDDGIAATVVIQTGWIKPGVMGITGVITKPDGLTVPFRYPWLWRGA